MPSAYENLSQALHIAVADFSCIEPNFAVFLFAYFR